MILKPECGLLYISVKNMNQLEIFHKFASYFFPGNKCFKLDDEPMHNSLNLKLLE